MKTIQIFQDNLYCKLSIRPFIFLTFFFALGIWASKVLPFSSQIYILAFLIFFTIRIFTPSKSLLILFLFLLLAGGVRYSLIGFHPTNHISQVLPELGGEKLHIIGKISSEPEYFSEKTKFILKVQKIENLKVNGKILIRISGKTNLAIGDKISYYGSIQRPGKSTNPYSFNYTEFLESRGIYGLSYLYHQKVKVIGNEKTFLSEFVIPVRQFVRQKIIKFYPSKQAGFLQAILLGEKGALSDDLREDFANSGLSHILAVSGLHTGVIALILLTLFQIIVRKKNLARIFTIIFLVYYVFLSHSVPSVQRAVIMISLILIGKILQRKSDTINILFAAGFIILAINPNQLFSVGFQFSFSSVFAILVIFPLFSRLLRKIRKKSRAVFWGMNMVLLSLTIQTILAPFTIYYFHKVAFGGIFSNPIAIPLVGFILPLSILTIILPIPLLNTFYVAANEVLLRLLFGVSKFVSMHKILLFEYIYLDKWQVFTIILLILILVLLWDKNENLKAKRRKFVMGFFLIIFILFVPHFFQKHLLKLTVLDVKLGDSIFLQTPLKKNILIDTGNKSQHLNYGERVVMPYLLNEKIDHLDLLVLTHPHADHIGGAAYIINKIKINRVLMPKCDYDSELYHKLENLIGEKEISVTFADTSVVFDDFPSVKLDLLFPVYDYYSENVNNYSIVLRCDYKEFSCLLTGDAEKEVENWLVEIYGDGLDVDVLKVCHHGSKTSSTQEFLQLVTPEYAAVSVGTPNKFGLPNKIIMDRLEQNTNEYFRTDRDGAIIFLTDGMTLEIKTILTEKCILDSSL
ncbi:MAG: DNA internalization-related competence protein ComEC/Rec2 [Candidatus Cloacimonadota bacterium]|nr:DNA internalization-related competence protein ComEC/Rec2 [Candidatus Cloacimonadota bacterium]